MTRRGPGLAATVAGLTAALLAVGAAPAALPAAPPVAPAVAPPVAQGPAPRGDVQPTNNLPNPYQTIPDYFKMPEGRVWGSTSAVEIDLDGRSVWVAERCGANTCVNSNLPTIFKFDASGRLVKSFGEGLFIFPHGIDVDQDGNVWVADNQPLLPLGAPRLALAKQFGPLADAPKAGHRVYKFSPDGALLMTLGQPGGAAAPDYFFHPNDVLVAPDGSIFVSEGHGGANSRILKFARDGRLLTAFGKKGTARGEFDSPHALAMDSKGRLFVGDRGNNRIQILDQEGRFLDEWKQFSRPSGLFIDHRDTLYVADSESGSVAPDRTSWKRGIRIGSANDGSVTAFIPDPLETSTATNAAEGVAADSDGNVYGAEVNPRGVKKYVRRR